MNRIALSLFTAAALVACADAPTSPSTMAAPSGASRQVIVNDHFDGLVFGFSACSGESMTGTGKVHTVIGTTADAAGGFHVSVHQQFSNLHLVGDVSGADYTGSQEYHDNYNLTVGQEETNLLTFNLIGKGKVPNEVFHALFHITVNANGEVTSVVDNFSDDCH